MKIPMSVDHVHTISPNIMGELVHGARTVHTVWGNCPAFAPQLDLHGMDIITRAL